MWTNHTKTALRYEKSIAISDNLPTLSSTKHNLAIVYTWKPKNLIEVVKQMFERATHNSGEKRCLLGQDFNPRQKDKQQIW